MILKRFSSYINKANGEQALEFTFTKHLFICLDKTAGRFHLHYRYDDVEHFFMEVLTHSGHEVTRLNDQVLSILDDQFNDMSFKAYRKKGGGIVLFDGLAIGSSEGGLVITEHPSIHPGWNLIPNVETLFYGELMDDTKHNPEVEITWLDMDEPISSKGGERFNPQFSYLSCDIRKDDLTEMALQLAHITYRIWDEFFRAPGEDYDDEDYIEYIERTWNDLHGFYQTIHSLKHAQSQIMELLESGYEPEPELTDILTTIDALSAEIGFDLSQYDTDGKMIPRKE